MIASTNEDICGVTASFMPYASNNTTAVEVPLDAPIFPIVDLTVAAKSRSINHSHTAKHM